MKSKLKILIPIIIVLIIFLVGLFIVVKNTYSIELKKDKFIYEYGEEIVSDVSVYLKDANSTKNINNYVLTSKSLDINNGRFVKNNSEIVPVGNYEVTIKYKKKSKNFVIEVLDTVAPEFISSKEIIEIEETTEEIDLTSYFEVKDLSSVTLKIEGEYNLSKAGEYDLKAIAEDESNNFVERNFVLKVKEKPKEVVKDKSNNSNSNSSSNKNSNTNNNNNNNNNNQSTNKVTNTTPTTPYSGYRKDISDSYVSQVNAYRKANGKAELPVTTEAQIEADKRAKELVSNYSHEGVGYGFGEVIGNGTAGGDFIAEWKKSPPHDETLLRVQNTAIAASVYEYNNRWYAVISFRMNY